MLDTFAGRVEFGKLKLHLRDRFAKLVASLEGKEIEITLKKRSRNRSHNQNRYYWGCVIAMLAEHCGYDPEEMHEALKQRFLAIHTEGPLPTVRSTVALNTAEFTTYLEQCRRLAAEMGVIVPDPGGECWQDPKKAH
jgi:hypothetical protein